jgi:hypothetical protein
VYFIIEDVIGEGKTVELGALSEVNHVVQGLALPVRLRVQQNQHSDVRLSSLHQKRCPVSKTLEYGLNNLACNVVAVEQNQAANLDKD